MARVSGSAKVAAKKTVKQSATRTAAKAKGGRVSPGSSDKTVKVPKSRTAKGKAPAERKLPPPAVPSAPLPDLYSSLHALLHTMRLIERHDEPLCSMHDELKRTGKLSARQRRRLQQLVDELPAEDYQADLHTLRQAVAA